MAYLLDGAIGYISEMTVRNLRVVLDRTFKENGFEITPYQYIILYRLWEEEGLSQTEICNKTIMDNGAITRMIDILEKKNLVIRKPCQDDRRKYRIFLTDRGKEIKDKMIQIANDHHENAMKGITEEEYKIVVKVMETVRRNLKNS